MKERRIIIVLLVLTILFTIIGGTFSYLNWESNDARKTNVTFTVNPDFTCGADGGGDITSSDVELIPTDCTNSTYVIKREITTNVTTVRDKVVSMDLWLDINSISTNLSNSDNFKYVLSKNGNSCTSGIISQGTFKNKHQNDQVQLLNGEEYATLDDTYYLYIWLDKAETNINTMNQSFSFSLGGTCQDNGVEKATLKSLDTTNFFRETDYKTKVTDIYFVYDEDLPSGIQTNNIKTYDMGENANKPITGYLIENTDPGAAADTYKVYVSSEYKIYTGNLNNAFYGMTELKNVSFDNFDTSVTTNMFQMFRNCSSLTSLDLSNFNTKNVNTMRWMFNGCSNLANLNISSFNTSNVTQMNDMFEGCRSLTSLDLSNFDTSNVTSMHYMFSGCSSLTSLDLSNFETPRVTSMNYMFSGCSSLTTLDISNFNTSLVTRMDAMFSGCSSLTSLNVSSFNTSNVTNMSSMFQNCSNLTSLNVSNFNTAIVTNMTSMFYGCSNLTSLDLSNFNTSNVTEMYRMFNECSSLTSLNVYGFNTANVTTMAAMFNGCSNLTSLDLSSFNTSNVSGGSTQFSGMNNMFNGCSNLETIYVSNLWNTDNFTNESGSTFRMFNGNTMLVGGMGTRFDSNYRGKEYARIDNPPDSPGYLTYKAYPSS